MNYSKNGKSGWLRRNFIWLFALTALVLSSFVLLVNFVSVGNVSGYASALSDSALYDRAVIYANKNKPVAKELGHLSYVGKMAILEGTTDYSDDKQRVNTSVRISCAKANAKLDIKAERKGNFWNYQTIALRTRSGKVISVVHEGVTTE